MATVTLSSGNVITLTGAVSGDKHWVQLQASKDPALNAKAAGRAFELAGYRYDAIFRPLEQLLVPKPPPPAANKAAAGRETDAEAAARAQAVTQARHRHQRRIRPPRCRAAVRRGVAGGAAGGVHLRRRVLESSGGGRAAQPPASGFYLYRIGLVAVIAGYYLINWTRSGQTLGMRAWHLRAVTESGQTLGWKAAALRFACGVLAWAPAALGVLWLYADPEHLALHDRLSRTRVVHLSRS